MFNTQYAIDAGIFYNWLEQIDTQRDRESEWESEASVLINIDVNGHR